MYLHPEKNFCNHMLSNGHALEKKENPDRSLRKRNGEGLIRGKDVVDHETNAVEDLGLGLEIENAEGRIREMTEEEDLDPVKGIVLMKRGVDWFLSFELNMMTLYRTAHHYIIIGYGYLLFVLSGKFSFFLS